MKLKHIFYLVLSSTIFLIGCSNCVKLNLTQSEKGWVNHFKLGQQFDYKNVKGGIDTLEIIDTSDYYTPCNKFELSEYQFEIYLVRFKIKSRSIYNNDESYISVTTEKWQKNNPYIYFGNLGPHKNDLANKIPIAIDTVLNKITFKSVYYYAKGLNTEQYGEKEYFKNFFWDKLKGLIAYTNMNNETFIRVN